MPRPDTTRPEHGSAGAVPLARRDGPGRVVSCWAGLCWPVLACAGLCCVESQRDQNASVGTYAPQTSRSVLQTSPTVAFAASAFFIG